MSKRKTSSERAPTRSAYYVIKANGMFWGNRRLDGRAVFGFGDLRGAVRYPTRQDAETVRTYIGGYGVVTRRFPRTRFEQAT